MCFCHCLTALAVLRIKTFYRGIIHSFIISECSFSISFTLRSVLLLVREKLWDLVTGLQTPGKCNQCASFISYILFTVRFAY